jgi:hypothetical protein
VKKQVMVVDIAFWIAWNEQRLWRGMVQEFNQLRRGQIRVTYRTFLGLTSTEFFDELRQMFDDPGRNPIEVTGGDVIWPAALVDNGWVEDLSGRFPYRSGSSSSP